GRSDRLESGYCPTRAGGSPLLNSYDRHSPAGFLDLLARALREAMRRNLERLRNLAVTEHHDVVFRFLDDAAVVQNFRSDFVFGREAPLQRLETHFDPLLLENVREAAFRQTTMQWHLPAFESDLRRVAGTRLLSLFTAARGFTKTSAGSATETLFLVRRALR